MVLGCRYTLPPVDMAALADLYGDVTGEVTQDMCVRVLYKKTMETGTPVDNWHHTTCVELEEGRPTPITVIGMYPETEYQLMHEYVRVVRPQPWDDGYQFTMTTGPHYIEPSASAPSVLGVQGGESLTYTTREIPKEVAKHIPDVNLNEGVITANIENSEDEPWLMWATIVMGMGKYVMSFVTDLNGNVVYYIPYYKGVFTFNPVLSGMISRPGGRGNWFFDGSGGSSMNPDLTNTVTSQMFAEVDCEGVPIWSLSIWEINDILLESGYTEICEVIGHHDAIRLPNGESIVYAGYGQVDKSKSEYIETVTMLDYYSKMGKSDVPVPLDYIETVPLQHFDMILHFNADHSIKSVWRAVDHIYMTYEEQDAYSMNVVNYDLPGMGVDPIYCPGMGVDPIYYGDVSSDRTHMNSLFFDPTDNNLLVSVRSQDSVYKLNWSGDDAMPEGDVMYNLRDFALYDREYNPIHTYDEGLSLFSHQHCAQMYSVDGHPDLKVITLFDNSNTVAMVQRPEEKHHSNAVALLVNEAMQEMVLLFRTPLPEFGFALGTSQALSNGNFHYHVGVHDAISGEVGLFGTSTTVYELTPEGEFLYSVEADACVY
ncbi:arylsulfotransferase, partial [Kipferlia bialata]|eukprot:g7140.t1